MFTLFRHGPDRFPFLPRTYCFGPSFARATPWQVLVPPPGGPPKKSLRDFATLANLGHFALRSA